jgi:polygalacturonase
MKKSAHLINVALIFILIFSSANLNAYGGKHKTNGNAGWNKVPEILKKINPPVFHDRDFKISDYGAVEGGKVLCTDAFRKAIDACSKAGGGRVIVPKGEFLTGAIHLKSNINLHLSDGAVLKFSTDPDNYLPVVFSRWEGTECMNYSPLIYAFGQKNIAITGSGILDGQASEENWWKWKSLSSDKQSRPRLMKLGDENVPVKERIFGKGYYLRPSFIEFYKCENILIEGVTLKDSPFWFLHPVLSKNITITAVKTNSKGPNTDGCDPESCSNVLIQNCEFTDGDDCIAIKSGRNNDGRRINIPSTNIVIRKCRMKDGHGGVSIGSEITGGCWNVYTEDCEMDSPNLDRALRIKSNAKRGGIIKNIYMRNVKVGQVADGVIWLNMKYDPEEAKGYTYYPVMENIYVENITSKKSKYGLFLDGLTESKIKNVYITNCRFDGVEDGNKITDTVNVKLNDVYLNGKLIQ